MARLRAVVVVVVVLVFGRVDVPGADGFRGFGGVG